MKKRNRSTSRSVTITTRRRTHSKTKPFSLENSVKKTLHTIEKQYSKGTGALQSGITSLKKDFNSAMNQRKSAQKKVVSLAKQFRTKSTRATKIQMRNAQKLYNSAVKNSNQLKKQLETSMDRLKRLVANQKQFIGFVNAMKSFERKWSTKRSTRAKARGLRKMTLSRGKKKMNRGYTTTIKAKRSVSRSNGRKAYSSASSKRKVIPFSSKRGYTVSRRGHHYTSRRAA